MNQDLPSKDWPIVAETIDSVLRWAAENGQRSEAIKAHDALVELTTRAEAAERERDGMRKALRRIAAFKTGGPHRPGQVKAEHREMIAIARSSTPTPSEIACSRRVLDSEFVGQE